MRSKQTVYAYYPHIRNPHVSHPIVPALRETDIYPLSASAHHTSRLSLPDCAVNTGYKPSHHFLLSAPRILQSLCRNDLFHHVSAHSLQASCPNPSPVHRTGNIPALISSPHHQAQYRRVQPLSVQIPLREQTAHHRDHTHTRAFS